MEFDRKLKLLDEIVERYRATRKAHIQSKWHTFSALWARIRGKNPGFDTLRNVDMEFFQRAHSLLRTHLKNGELDRKEIGEMALYLKNHQSIIAQRDFFLVVYAVIIGVMLLVPRNDWKSWVVVGLATLFGLAAVIERWNMKRNDCIYKELAEFLLHEAKEG